MSGKYISVEGHDNLVRDVNSGAIININTDERQKRRSLKQLKNAEKQRLDNIENEITEIKNLLTKLIEKS
tara:strand:- start:195 stop:404 length:210 start_codon:yes stop_codon:yes gene_type:complete